MLFYLVFVVLISLSRNKLTEGALPGCLVDTTNLVAIDQTGSLKTPNYPAAYPAKLLCTWLITAPQHHVVVLYFNDFSVKTSFGCKDDYFLIRDGPNSTSPLLLRLCGIGKHCPVSSSGRYMWVQFVSDKKSTSQGVYITYAAVSNGSTSGNLGPVTLWKRNTVLDFTSKGISDKAALLTCIWKISAPRGRLIRFSIKWESVLEYLDILDGPSPNSPKITRLDGLVKNAAHVTSSGVHVVIRIVHDWRYGFLFMIAFRAVISQEHSKYIDGCFPSTPINVMSDNTTITSPFHPQYYPNNQQCQWRIIAPRNYHIRIRFQNFDLAQPGDYVEIRDGYSDSADLIGKFTSSPGAFYLASTGRFLWVRFKSNQENAATGFLLRFKFVFSLIVHPTTTSVQLISTLQPTPTYSVQLISTLQPTLTYSVQLISTLQPTPTYSVQLISTSSIAQDQFNLTAKGSQSNKTLVVSKNISTNQPPFNTTIIVGVALGSCFLIVIALILLVLVIKKKQEVLSRKQIVSYTAELWEISSDQVTLTSELGHGAFGKVWQGEIEAGLTQELKTRVTTEERSVRNNNLRTTEEKVETVTVAVKLLHDDATPDACREFLREIELMKTVGFHRNIASMVACCTKEQQVFLVVEYAMHGDLLNFLRRRRVESRFLNISRSEPLYENSEQLQKVENLVKDFLSFSWQIAQGMEYLASKGLVHRDLAARNILVAQDDQIKVADFGLSRHVTYEGGTYRANGPRKLPIKWMSPEAIYDQTFTTKSDVWSYGVVLWEIYTMGGSPYPTISNRQLVKELRDGYRMEKPNLCGDDMFRMMMACWQEIPDDRPSFTKIKQDIEELMTQDNPYLEIQGIDQTNDCYLVPSFNSAVAESEEVV